MTTDFDDLTAEQKRRAEVGLAETRRKLARELQYSPVFQKKHVIGFYQRHIEKLERMLSK